jgi:hypothetical protein
MVATLGFDHNPLLLAGERLRLERHVELSVAQMVETCGWPHTLTFETHYNLGFCLESSTGNAAFNLAKMKRENIYKKRGKV